MAVLPVLRYPDPRLKTVAKPIDLGAAAPDVALQQLIADMFETMTAENGIGLAATQVDVHRRLIVMDVSEERNQPLVLINPELTWTSAEKAKSEEGCLSVPGIYDGVERHVSVKVKAADAQGVVREIEADGLLAVCIQHEMDHLAGKVFVSTSRPSSAAESTPNWTKNAKPGHGVDAPS
jgi:peptide deformylase